MPLVRTKEMLADAKDRGYAVGAFNIANLEFVLAVVDAAEEERAPVILQAYHPVIDYAGVDTLVAMVESVARGARVPVAFNLDHGASYEQAVRCIEAGFTSVMIDGSALPFDENVAVTQRVVEAAHKAGVDVEGSLGIVPAAGSSTQHDVRSLMTDPEAARIFVKETGVDSLAVAVGSVHRMKTQECKLDIERIKAVREQTDAPLVLHGASGVNDENFKDAVAAGLCKINVATALKKAFVQGLRDAFEEDSDVIEATVIGYHCRKNIKEIVKEKMRLFGCSGRA